MGNFGRTGIGRGWADLQLFWRGRKHHFFLATKEQNIARVKHLLRVGWRNLVRVSLIFAIIVSFMLCTVFPLVYILYFKEFLIQDSLGFMILKNNLPNLLGLRHFPLNT